MQNACQVLEVCRKTLQWWDNTGKVRMVRTPGGRRRVPESELIRLLGEKNGDRAPWGRVFFSLPISHPPGIISKERKMLSGHSILSRWHARWQFLKQ
ncbi:MAG: helix-turn-helix domain-containing protein [Peptococcaceae bacterium]|nr:helix-turn-helix domain-containing protein [Peptococcaceae bacterium]